MSASFAFQQLDALKVCNSLSNARALVRAIVHTCPDFETFLSEPDAGLVRQAFKLVDREGVGTSVCPNCEGGGCSSCLPD